MNAITKQSSIPETNVNCDDKSSNSTAKGWRQKLGYCSVFTLVPAVLASSMPAALVNQANQSKVKFTALDRKLVQRLNITSSKLSLLKRQSEFRLPQQQGGANTVSLLSGLDDCPGRSIPGGTYTAAGPYLDSGNTTGANNTVNHVLLDYGAWSSEWESPGADHIYSFTLTGLGPNPQIQVSTQSNSYRPLIFLLDTQDRLCPSGNVVTKNLWWLDPVEVVSAPGTATISNQAMHYVPLNVPLYLVVDSLYKDATGSGPYTLRIQDVTIAGPVSTPNPIDSPEFFVRQHYLDFLNREPDQDGLNAWLQVLNRCENWDHLCKHEQRLTTSAGFFGSREFGLKGYFALRFYRVAFARLPDFAEFTTDIQTVTGQTPTDVLLGKANFANSFVQRPEFTALYNHFSNADYVAALLAKYGLTSVTDPHPNIPDDSTKVTLTQTELVNGLNGGTLTRAQVLRAVAESDEVFQFEFNRAFVAMQYFGYLRRNPEPAGYNAWLDYLNAHPQDFFEMVRGFVDSTEYRSRFGQP